MQLDLLEWSPPSAPAQATEWLPGEVERMIELYVAADVPKIAEIARTLNKSYAQIASKATRIGIIRDVILGWRAGLAAGMSRGRAAAGEMMTKLACGVDGEIE